MSSSAAADTAYQQNSYAMVLMIVATEAMRSPVITAQLDLSPAGWLKPACSEISSVTGGATAKMDEMKPRSCAVRSKSLIRGPLLVHPQISSVETECASGMLGGATIPLTALMAVTKKTVVREASGCVVTRQSVLQKIHFLESIPLFRLEKKKTFYQMFLSRKNQILRKLIQHSRWFLPCHTRPLLKRWKRTW